MVTAQRLIVRKGSLFGEHAEKIYSFPSLKALRLWARVQKKVFSYVTEKGRNGIMRSGRLMRPVDANVRNTVHNNLKR